ncbi:MAG: hypothetical protein V4666_07915 [Bacteroidota bacterium]
MIQEAFNSFKENINQRTKNPLLGTFIIVWIIRNWKFVYSLFYFDKELKLNGKLLKIEFYFKNYDFKEILVTIFVTFIVLISTYVLMSLSRLIISFFEKVVTPKISQITDKSSIVLKSDYNNVQLELERLELKVQEEKANRIRIQNDNEILERRVLDLLTPNASSTEQDDVTRKPLNDKAIKIFNKLTKEDNIEKYNKMVSIILSDYTLKKDDESIQEFINLGLIRPTGNHQGNGHYKFFLTPLGESVHEQILNETLK